MGSSIWHTNTVKMYINTFDTHFPPSVGLREDIAISVFVNGLHHGIRPWVTMFNPSSLLGAKGLAMLAESQLINRHKMAMGELQGPLAQSCATLIATTGPLTNDELDYLDMISSQVIIDDSSHNPLHKKEHLGDVTKNLDATEIQQEEVPQLHQEQQVLVEDMPKGQEEQQEHQIFEQIQQKEKKEEQEQLSLQLEKEEQEILHQLQQSKEEIWQALDADFLLLQQHVTAAFQQHPQHLEAYLFQPWEANFSLQQYFQQYSFYLPFIWTSLHVWRSVGYYGKVGTIGSLLSLLLMGSCNFLIMS